MQEFSLNLVSVYRKHDCFVVHFSRKLRTSQRQNKCFIERENCLSLSPLFLSPLFFASWQPLKVSRRSTRSPASRRPKVWTASMKGCRRAATRCPVTLAWTRSTRRCPRRATAPTARVAAPAGAAASSEDGDRSRTHCGLRRRRRRRRRG